MLRVLVPLSLTLVGCQDFFTLHAQAREVCQHSSGQRFVVPSEVRERFAQLPPEMQGQSLEVSKTFEFDISAKLPPEVKSMVDAHFALSSVRLTAVEGSADLGFVEEAHVTLTPTAAGLTPRTFDYEREDPEARQIRWNGEAFDVGAYLEAGSLKYEVSLRGTMPPEDVMVDIDACASVDVAIEPLQ